MINTQLQYQSYLKLATKSGKKIEDWIQEWQDIMAKGLKYEVPETKSVRMWSNDLLTAIQPLIEIQTLIFKTINKEKVQNRTLNYQEVGMSLLKAQINQQNRKGASKSIKAGFPALHGEEAEPLEEKEAALPNTPIYQRKRSPEPSQLPY